MSKIEYRSGVQWAYKGHSLSYLTVLNMCYMATAVDTLSTPFELLNGLKVLSVDRMLFKTC